METKETKIDNLRLFYETLSKLNRNHFKGCSLCLERNMIILYKHNPINKGGFKTHIQIVENEGHLEFKSFKIEKVKGYKDYFKNILLDISLLTKIPLTFNV